MKRLAAAVLCLSTIITNGLHITASSPTVSDTIQKYIDSESVSQVTSVDLLSGKIEGVNADYTFMLPNEWKENVTAEWESVSDVHIIEKLNFYCKAQSGLYRSKLLASLYVFDKTLWNDPSGYTPVLRSKDYVFAYQLGDSEGFTLAVDQDVYRTCRNLISNANLMKDYIVIPDSQQETPTKSVFVNDEQVYGNVQIIDKVYYLPLRDVCEALGYTIGYNSRTKKITVTKGSFSDEFKIFPGKGTDSRGIKMLNISGRTYVSTAYFMKVLGLSVRIDSDKNVYLY